MRPKVAQTRGPGPVAANPDEKRERDRPEKHQEQAQRVAKPSQDSTPAPRPPRLPGNFRGKGRWIVRDLGITVPFSWEGRNGDSQMIAGGPKYPIWFTNLIYHGTLYTLTYKWPGLTEHPCSRIPGFDLDGLNRLKQMAVPADHQEGGTMIVPGHGRLCDIADLAVYQHMVTIVRDRLQDMIKSGMTLEQE